MGMFTINECIKKIMKEKGITQKQLARMLRITQQGASDRVRNPNVSLNKAIETLEALGYEVIIRPFSKGVGHSGEIVLERVE